MLAACNGEEKVDEATNLETVEQQGQEADVVSISNTEEAEENTEEEFDELEVSFQPYLIETELNKRNVVLLETENGKVTLVGEKLTSFPGQSDVSMAVKYEGELQRILRTVRPKFRVITDAGEVFEHYKTQERVGEDGAIYMEYVFPEVIGDSVARIDYQFDGQDGDFEKVILEPTTETTSIPAVYNYTSVLTEPFEVKDSAKTILFKSITYDYDGTLSVVADVIYNEDIAFEDAKVYITEPHTQRTADAWLEGEFFAGIPKEIAFSMRMENLSQNIPYVKLYLLDTVVNLKLFTGEPFENEIEVVSLEEEPLSKVLLFERNDYKIANHIYYPELNGLVDTLGTLHYDAKSYLVEFSYGIGTQYHFKDLQLTTTDYSTLDLTLAVEQNDEAADIVVTFVSDDYERNNVDDLPVISGTVLQEVTIPANGEPQRVSVDVKNTEQLIIFMKNEYEYGQQRLIITDSKLKK